MSSVRNELIVDDLAATSSIDDPGTEEHASPAATFKKRGLARRVLSKPITVAAVAFLCLVLLVAILVPFIAPYGELDSDFGATLQGPSSEHLLGTDQLGRDTLSRLMFGSRVALQAVLQAMALAAGVGVTLGLVIGYVGGRIDRVAMRVVDVLYSIPGLVTALAIIAILGPGLTTAMLAVGIIFATSYLRLTRGVTLAVREELYVDAARVTGAGFATILRRHVLPNIASPLIIQTAIICGQIILIEAALSFLGLGRDIERASWGGMLATALEQQYVQPFLAIPPGFAIVLTVLAFNILGDGLRDAMGRDIGRHHLSRKDHITAKANSADAHPGAVTKSASKPAFGYASASEQRSDVVFEIAHLDIAFRGDNDVWHSVVSDVSLELQRGETLALVGESGSGKTMTALAAIDLLPAGGRVMSGEMRWTPRTVSEVVRYQRGRDIAMVFQEPMTALNPALTIGQQIAAPARRHLGLSKREARARAIEMLARVGVPDPGRRVDDYPHQFSGGMAQRALIAMALVCDPPVLIADEPTTALDVTIQGQIVDLLLDLQAESGMAMLFVTHDLGLVADVATRVAVMYAGQVVERADVGELFAHPQHPYTQALLAAMPAQSASEQLPIIPGRVPAAWERPKGCWFRERCQHAIPECGLADVHLEPSARDHLVRCIRVGALPVEASS